MSFSSSLDFEQIEDIFKRGKSFNLRTLFFILHIFYEIAKEINEYCNQLIEGNQEAIYQRILNYCCFYSIEYKKGIPSNILNQVTISYNQIGLLDETDVKSDSNNSSSEIIKQIQNKYFSGKSIEFSFFESIANFITNGRLNSSELKKEINSTNKRLKATTIKEIQIEDIYLYNNDEYVQKIQKLMYEAENGRLDQIQYLRFLYALIELNRYHVDGIEDIQIVRKKLLRGILIAKNEDRLYYIPNLEIQIHPCDIGDKLSDLFNSCRSLVLNVNDKILEKNYSMNIDLIREYIKTCNNKALYTLITDKDKLNLSKNDAIKIYEVLRVANANEISNFYDALRERYKKYLPEHTISQMRKYEKDFIYELYNQLKNDTTPLENSKKQISHLQLIRLKNLLKIIMDDKD